MQTASPERIAHFRSLGWWGDTTTWQLFEQAVAANPDAVALLDPANRQSFTTGTPLALSWGELRRRVLALAGELKRDGIARGDVVVLQLPNTVESIASYLALAALGAIASPVPMQYGLHELREIAHKLHPRAYVAAAHFRGEDFTARHAGAFAPDTRLIALDHELIGADRAADESVIATGVSADEVYTICWTSGTTGTPKGVPRSHNQWLSQTLAMHGIGLEPGMRMLCPFPMVNMASITGFFFPWLQLGGTLVLHHPMDVAVFLAQIRDERVAYTIAPPAVLNMLLQKRELLAGADLSSLRLVASGSAPLAPWMVRAFQEEFGIVVVNIFGSNEGMAFASSGLDVPDPEQRATLFPRFGVEGLAWSNPIAARMRSRLVDIDSGSVITEPGHPGEMQIQGPNVIDGYFDAPQGNAGVFSADGWFRSGDMFEIAPEDPRFYRFTGRCKDIIIRGGMKISPDELDTLLGAHPQLAEAAVTGYPDAVMGERVCAVVVARPGEQPTLESITQYLEGRHLARNKLPEKLVIVDALPRNPLGKVVRAALRGLVIDEP